jgi:hypothetical protein
MKKIALAVELSRASASKGTGADLSTTRGNPFPLAVVLTQPWLAWPTASGQQLPLAVASDNRQW